MVNNVVELGMVDPIALLNIIYIYTHDIFIIRIVMLLLSYVLFYFRDHFSSGSVSNLPELLNMDPASCNGRVQIVEGASLFIM